MKRCQAIKVSLPTAAFYSLSLLKHKLKPLEASNFVSMNELTKVQMGCRSRIKPDSPDGFLLACSPYLNPKSLRTGSLWSSCSVHCDWTWHLRWRKWSRRRMSDCLGLLAPRTLNKSSKAKNKQTNKKIKNKMSIYQDIEICFPYVVSQ